MAELPPAPPVAPALRSSRGGPLYVTLFGAWFAPWPGALWAAWAISSLTGPLLPVLSVLVGIITLLLLAWAVTLYRAAKPIIETPSYLKRWPVYAAFWLIFAVEVGCILVGNVVLARTHHTAWGLPLIALVVGLHFFPLARLFRAPLWYIAGGALCVLVLIIAIETPATATLRVPGGGDANAWQVLIPASAAMVFWATSIASAFMTRETIRHHSYQ